MKIYGAGIAGLLAGAAFQRAELFESSPEGLCQHKAVLRFRTPQVGEAVGIDFRKVTVRKGIYFQGEFVKPNLRLANFYSQKVIGRLVDRSIWNLEPATRFIAPETFIEQLMERCSGRVHWNHTLTSSDVLNRKSLAISTLPMKTMADFLQVDHPTFVHAPIKVMRWRVPSADVFQTVYFPEPDSRLYRASITGDMLIAEYVDSPHSCDTDYRIFEAFGLSMADVEPLTVKSLHKYGKIAPIDEAWRKQFIFSLTQNHNILSLGRYGTWRNILLDDVIHDIAVLKKLTNSSDYERMKLNIK